MRQDVKAFIGSVRICPADEGGDKDHDECDRRGRKVMGYGNPSWYDETVVPYPFDGKGNDKGYGYGREGIYDHRIVYKAMETILVKNNDGVDHTSNYPQKGKDQGQYSAA